MQHNLLPLNIFWYHKIYKEKIKYGKSIICNSISTSEYLSTKLLDVILIFLLQILLRHTIIQALHISMIPLIILWTQLHPQNTKITIAKQYIFYINNNLVSFIHSFFQLYFCSPEATDCQFFVHWALHQKRIFFLAFLTLFNNVQNGRNR